MIFNYYLIQFINFAELPSFYGYATLNLTVAVVNPFGVFAATCTDGVRRQVLSVVPVQNPLVLSEAPLPSKITVFPSLSVSHSCAGVPVVPAGPFISTRSVVPAEREPCTICAYKNVGVAERQLIVMLNGK